MELATGHSHRLGDPGGPDYGNQSASNRRDGEYTGRRLPSYMDPAGTSGPLQVMRLQGINGPLPANPFLIRKSVEAFLGGTIDGASRENRGATYALNVRSKAQFQKLLTMSKLGDGTSVSVVEHPFLNISKCVVSCVDAIELSDEHLLSELKDQGVKEVYRIKKRTPEGKLENTPAIVLTFTGTVVPSHVNFGWSRCPTRTYYPNPMRCFRCWDFGHTGKRCPSAVEICGNCGKHHPVDEGMTIDDNSTTSRQRCTDTQACKFCRNCNHPTSSRKCPLYLKEVEVQRVKIDRGISYPQARREVETRSGSGPTTSFANVAAASKDREIEDLRKKIEQLQKANQERKTVVANRIEAVQQNGTIEDLVSKVANLTETITKLQESLEVKDKIIERLRRRAKEDAKNEGNQADKQGKAKEQSKVKEIAYDIFSSSEDMETTPIPTPKRDRAQRNQCVSSDSSMGAPKTKRGAIPKLK